MRIKARRLTTTYKDICSLVIPGGSKLCETLTIPPQLQRLGYLNINGNFTGFYNDFVANAVFRRLWEGIYRPAAEYRQFKTIIL